VAEAEERKRKQEEVNERRKNGAKRKMRNLRASIDRDISIL